MNGAQALIRTLVACGVDTCFMNPGTSEMHFVAALDAVPEMHSVLALFEGVATGAADGYGRMADRPAATLLHLGPGSRQRARQPAQRAQGADARRQHRRRPRDLPQAVRRAARVRHRDGRAQRVELHPLVGQDRRGRHRRGRHRRRRVRAARSGRHARAARRHLVGRRRRGREAEDAAPRGAAADDAEIRAIADGAAVGRAGGAARRRDRVPRVDAGRRARDRRRDGRQAPVRDVPGADRARRGPCAGRPHRVPRRVRGDAARRAAPPRARRRQSAGVVLRVSRQGELAGTRGLRGPHARRRRPTTRARPLAALADALGVDRAPRDAPAARAARAADRTRSPRKPCARHSARLLPEGAIVSDEGNTSGLFAAGATAGAPPHDWLCLTGGAIGQGLPVAVGAAVACRDRRVDRARIRRQRDVHAAVVVDDGARRPRRHDDPVQQRLVRGAQHGARPGRRREPRDRGPRRCSTSADPTSTSSRWRRAWA